MFRLRRLFGVLGVGSLVLAAQAPITASAAGMLTIGVDHVDFVNQQPAQGRLYEYTDFFSRSVKVHQGDTLDFKFAPFAFHVLAVARSEKFARETQPIATTDRDDPPSIATGKPKLLLNPNVFVGSDNGTLGPCGWSAPCNYRGGSDLKISGPPPFPPGPPVGPPPIFHWRVTMNAEPGTYTYFCYIHPGMRGTVRVVDQDDSTTTQAQNDAAGQLQFQQDRAQAMAAEQAANQVRFSGDEPGERTYFVKVGIGAADNHVAIDEMFPNAKVDPSKQLNLVAGDRVVYMWPDQHNVHSVTFPPDATLPFGEDCAAGFTPPPPGSPPPPPGPPPALCSSPEESNELAVDPGNAPSGTRLTNPGAIVDAGVHLGADFRLPTSLHWAVTTGNATAPGHYHFNCNIHDFMEEFLNVAPAPAGEDRST